MGKISQFEHGPAFRSPYLWDWTIWALKMKVPKSADIKIKISWMFLELLAWQL